MDFVGLPWHLSIPKSQRMIVVSCVSLLQTQERSSVIHRMKSEDLQTEEFRKTQLKTIKFTCLNFPGACLNPPSAATRSLANNTRINLSVANRRTNSSLMEFTLGKRSVSVVGS